MNQSAPSILVSLDHASVARFGGEVVLRDLSWTVRAGEIWAIVGPTSSGKTTLAEALQGQHRIVAGTIRWPFLDALRARGHHVGWPSEVIRLVSFKEQGWRFSYARHYYQQRFNFIEQQDDLTLEDFLRHGAAVEDGRLAGVARQLGIDDLLSLSLIKLSNGQMRRARIARALLARPRMLILDEPFIGLDAAGRDEVSAILGELARRDVPIVLITQPDAVPPWVTHTLELEGPRREAPPPLSAKVASRVDHTPASEPVIEMRNVSVAYGQSIVLRDVSWTVRAGERWAVLGPNGSGKSTLLSLISADHPQAYANDIRLFGRRRGSGESIWEIKRDIGLVSPELHLYFSEPLTVLETVATGFFDVLTRRPTSAEQRAAIASLLAEFGISHLAPRPFARLSTGEQRLVLLLRALVKRPRLVILDEPFQALDPATIAHVRSWLDANLRPEQTLLFVSHYEKEIPESVRHRLYLDQGKAVQETEYPASRGR